MHNPPTTSSPPSGSSASFQLISPSDLPSDTPSPSDIKVKRTNDPYADQEARWHLVKQYVLSVLQDKPSSTSVYLAAVNAVYEIETLGDHKNRSGSRIYREGGVVLNGLRLRLSKLLLAYRARFGSAGSEEDRITDEVFIKRWTKAARVFGYHDRHFVRQCTAEKSIMPADLPFPDKGRTTIFEFGRRIWFDEREIEQENRGPVSMAQSHFKRN